MFQSLREWKSQAASHEISYIFCPCRWILQNIFCVPRVLTQWVQIKTELSIEGGVGPNVGQARPRTDGTASSEAWCGLPQLCGHKELQRGAQRRRVLTDAGREARVRNRGGVTESGFLRENWFVQEEEEFGRCDIIKLLLPSLLSICLFHFCWK